MDLREWQYGDTYLKKAWWAVHRRFKWGRTTDIRRRLGGLADPVKAYKAGIIDAQAEFMDRIGRLQDALSDEFEQLECCDIMCGWRGPVSESVHPKHDPDKRLCPECGEVTEPTYAYSWRIAMRESKQRRADNGSSAQSEGK